MHTTRLRTRPLLGRVRGGRSRTAAAVLAVAALTLAGCAATETADSTSGTAGPVSPADDAPDAAAPDDAAPEDAAQPDDAGPAADGPLAFTAADLTGAEVHVAALAGEPVVLWFWAPWCTICRGEGPHVADVAAALDGEVTFLGVAGLGEVPDMDAFVSDTGTGGFTHLVDDDGSLWQRFGVSYQPAYAFIDSDGTVDVLVGALGPEELSERAEALS